MPRISIHRGRSLSREIYCPLVCDSRIPAAATMPGLRHTNEPIGEREPPPPLDVSIQQDELTLAHALHPRVMADTAPDFHVDSILADKNDARIIWRITARFHRLL